MTAQTAEQVLAGLVCDDGRRWGERATTRQHDDARAVLDRGTPHLRHWIGRPPGWARKEDAVAVSLAAMLTQLPPGPVAALATSDPYRARMVCAEFAGFAERSGLGRAIRVTGTTVTVVASGVTLEVLNPADHGSGPSRPALIVLENLAAWPQGQRSARLFEALMSSASKRHDCRVAIVSASADQDHLAWESLRRATGNSARWRVSLVSGAPPWRDEALLRSDLGEEAFRRVYDRPWHQPAAVDMSITPAALLARAFGRVEEMRQETKRVRRRDERRLRSLASLRERASAREETEVREALDRIDAELRRTESTPPPMTGRRGEWWAGSVTVPATRRPW